MKPSNCIHSASVLLCRLKGDVEQEANINPADSQWDRGSEDTVASAETD